MTFVLLAAGWFLTAGDARAQVAVDADRARATPASDDRAKATALLREGARLMDEKHPDGALATFLEAYRLVPSPKILFNLGVVYVSLARPAQALDAFQRFLNEAPDAPEPSLATARRHVTNLRAQVGTFQLSSDRASGGINIDGRDMGTIPFDRQLTVDPGHHQVRATAGDRFVEQQVDVAAGEEVTVTLTFGAPAPALSSAMSGTAIERGAGRPGLLRAPAPVPPPAAPVLTATPPAGDESSGTVPEGVRPLYRRTWFWIAAGGVVAVAAVLVAVSLSHTEYPTADARTDGP